MSKTYDDLREEIEHGYLQEGILRKGAALFYAAQVKQNGARVEQNISKSKQSFGAAKRQENITEKIDNMIDGFAAIGDALIDHRRMVGSLTGLSLSAALLAERTDKEITKLGKRK
jgi:hypothetical protein